MDLLAHALGFAFFSLMGVFALIGLEEAIGGLWTLHRSARKGKSRCRVQSSSGAPLHSVTWQ
ncbi:MAG: hypothetical protein Kow00104_04120 [Rhodothalassiaceae bacterium]